jgi:hypothetical protein
VGGFKPKGFEEDLELREVNTELNLPLAKQVLQGEPS